MCELMKDRQAGRQAGTRTHTHTNKKDIQTDRQRRGEEGRTHQRHRRDTLPSRDQIPLLPLPRRSTTCAAAGTRCGSGPCPGLSRAGLRRRGLEWMLPVWLLAGLTPKAGGWRRRLQQAGGDGSDLVAAGRLGWI